MTSPFTALALKLLKLRPLHHDQELQSQPQDSQLQCPRCSKNLQMHRLKTANSNSHRVLRCQSFEREKLEISGKIAKIFTSITQVDLGTCKPHPSRCWMCTEIAVYAPRCRNRHLVLSARFWLHTVRIGLAHVLAPHSPRGITP